MKKKLFIFSNESISTENDKFYCENLDLKSTPEGLNKKFEVNLFGRKSLKKRSHEIKIKKVKIFNNIFSYLSEVKNASRSADSKFLIISISPYTFLISLFLKIFGRKPIVYLRSDGYGEYKKILGYPGLIIYHLMFSIVSKICSLISCREYILRGKSGKLVSPSQLNPNWFVDPEKPDLNKVRLLYVGRIKKEKGIFSLLKLLKNTRKEFSLTIVGAEEDFKLFNSNNNIKVSKIVNSEKQLIDYYDSHNIFILPSFTEGHPMVLMESLSRLRPVIIFKDIEHVIENRKGIFACNRDQKSLDETINFIMKNYFDIQNEMKKNQLPTRKDFIDKIINLITNY